MTGADPNGAAPVRYPAALDELHARAAAGRLVGSPGGRVVASRRTLPEAPPGPLARFGLAVGPAGQDTVPATGPAADEFAAGLLALHHRVVRDLLQHALGHLAARISGGADLLSKQLVQAQCAEVAIRLSEDEAIEAAVGGAGRRARWQRYRRLVAAGRSGIRLLGGSGFLTDGPAAELHMAEVTGHIYLAPEANDVDD